MKTDIEERAAITVSETMSRMPRHRPAKAESTPYEAAPDGSPRAAIADEHPLGRPPRRRSAIVEKLPKGVVPDDTHCAEQSASGRGQGQRESQSRTAPAEPIDAAIGIAIPNLDAQHPGEGHSRRGLRTARALADHSDAAKERPATRHGVPRNGGGHGIGDDHQACASPEPISDGQATDEALLASAVASDQASERVPSRAEPPDRSPSGSRRRDAANSRTETIQWSPRHDSIDGHASGAHQRIGAVGDEAMQELKPNRGLPRRNPSDGQLRREAHPSSAVGGDDRSHLPQALQAPCSPVIAETIQLVRMRRRWIKAKNALVLQGKALCRGWTDGDKDEANKLYEAAKEGAPADPMLAMALAPFFAALTQFEADIEAIEKTLTKLGKALPVWKAWGEGVKGLSACGLAIIVGECSTYVDGELRDIGSYRNPSCLWKRMGLAVHDGHRQGNPGTDATINDWIFEAYSGVRRSVMWNIGNSLIGGMGKFRPMFGEDVDANPDYSPYQRLFATRCRYEAERLPNKDGTPVKLADKTGKESYSLHAANRAKRYVEKRLLRDLYAAWRRLENEREASAETPSQRASYTSPTARPIEAREAA